MVGADRDGLIASSGRVVTIIDEPALAELSHYRDRGDFDHEWLKLVDDGVRTFAESCSP